MKPVMYVFANRGAGMTPGKLAAQVAHAAVESFVLSTEVPAQHGFMNIYTKNVTKEWWDSGHYTKLVMLAEDEQHLFTIQKYLEDRGVKTKMVIDEGHTEVRAHTATALGVEIVNKDNPWVQGVFGDFKTYKVDSAPLHYRSSEKINLREFEKLGEILKALDNTRPVVIQEYSEGKPKRWWRRGS